VKLVYFIIIFNILVFLNVSTFNEVNNIYIELPGEKNNISFNYNESNYNLVQAQKNLQESYNQLESLKSGNVYNLHNPTLEEVREFISNDNNVDIDKILQNAKSKGIRCAYVECLFNTKNMVLLIGFNTINNGMIYFDEKDYNVYPLVGKIYEECVEGEPYFLSTDNIIIKIRVTW